MSDNIPISLWIACEEAGNTVKLVEIKDKEDERDKADESADDATRSRVSLCEGI